MKIVSSVVPVVSGAYFATTATGAVMTKNKQPIRLTPLGNIVVMLGFILVLGIAGWVEGM